MNIFTAKPLHMLILLEQYCWLPCVCPSGSSLSLPCCMDYTSVLTGLLAVGSSFRTLEEDSGEWVKGSASHLPPCGLIVAMFLYQWLWCLDSPSQSSVLRELLAPVWYYMLCSLPLHLQRVLNQSLLLTSGEYTICFLVGPCMMKAVFVFWAYSAAITAHLLGDSAWTA